MRADNRCLSLTKLFALVTKSNGHLCRFVLVPTSNRRGTLAKKTTKPRRYRDSVTGRFVTKKHAKKHPGTTVRERLQASARSDPTR